MTVSSPAGWRSETRTSSSSHRHVSSGVSGGNTTNSNGLQSSAFTTDVPIERPGSHAEVVNDTLSALVDDVEQTTEIIRKKQQQFKIERRQFQTEMEVTGRISVSPTNDWLSTRLKSVSTEDMKKELGKIKGDQRQNAVTDTLAALVYDVNATAEVLRRGSLGRDKDKKKKTAIEEVEYRLKLTPAPEEQPFPSPRSEPRPEENLSLEQFSRDYGVEINESQTEQRASLKRRARSETPRRILNIEGSPPPGPNPICAYCSEEIDGPILTALAPNSEKAQKFHTYHFMCTYCQKTLTMHGTYREHERKPYCHDCFYKLYNGLLYAPDEHQAQIEKLI